MVREAIVLKKGLLKKTHISELSLTLTERGRKPLTIQPADLKNICSFPRYGRLKLEVVFDQSLC